jgi:MYXO-CTERM domain-containing protein
MKHLSAGIGFLFGLGTTSAQALTLNAFDLDLITTSPADYNGAGTQINFPGNATGTAFTSLTLDPGIYTLNVSGQTNTNSAFRIQFGGILIAALADLGGNGNDIQSFSFTVASQTMASLLFTPVQLRANGPNFAGHLDASVSAVPVPGAIAGAGMPALVALGGLALWRRRKRPAAPRRDDVAVLE